MKSSEILQDSLMLSCVEIKEQQGLCRKLEVQVARLDRPQTRTVVAWGMTPRVIVASVVVGLVSFLVTELMHRFLVADLGRHWERLLAEGVSAVAVAGLTAGFTDAANQRQEAALLRMQVISEMNHHIRNALAAISLTADSILNHECVRVISDSVDRIEWTLREVLLRNKPISEKEIDRQRYAKSKQPSRSTYTGQEKTNEQRESSLRREPQRVSGCPDKPAGGGWL
jgi:signal transduction histidine kinase